MTTNKPQDSAHEDYDELISLMAKRQDEASNPEDPRLDNPPPTPDSGKGHSEADTKTAK